MARSKGESSIYQRTSDGLWCTSVELPRTPQGKRRRKVIANKSKLVVIKEMRRLQGELTQHGDLSTEVPFLRDWMTYWLEEVAALKLRPSTMRSHRGVARNFITPMLGHKRLDKITPTDVQKMTNRIQKTPKDTALRDLPESEWPADAARLSSTYALYAHNVLSGALKTAMRQEKINRNPCQLVDKPRKRITDEKALTVDMAIKFLRWCATAKYGDLWATFLLTGGREGEVLGLEIDRVQDVIDFSWQLQTLRPEEMKTIPADFEYRHVRHNLYLTRPKSAAGWRVQPLIEPLASILARTIGDRTEGFVFVKDGGQCWQPSDAWAAWKQALKDAGITEDVKLHGARHTTVDLLYEAEVPEAVIMEIVGHSSRGVTRGYRSRGNERIKADALGRVADLLQLDR